MPKRKIVISEYDNIAALMEEDRAVEFIIHRGDMLLGDVYLATVENVLPSIDAAFVNVGGDKMGFLHSSDVPGKGDLKTRLEPKQQLVVQIMKEPTGHKGPRVSTNISLPGRFLVMMPESKGISISRKIMEQSERSRLKSIVSLVKPPGVGVIIRTEAANQKDSDITEDFETLLERWQNIVSMADTATPPTLLYRDQDLLYRVIRETVTEDVTEIIVDSAFGQQRAQQLLQNWNMDKGVKVTHYQGAHPILVGTGVDKEIKLALQTKVPLPSGGYLYIQPTEALAVVDVNSGKFTSLHSQAETIKQTNLEACKEIARQLRLRNIGGMIIVDFIDMESRANQLTVLQSFENELAPDKAKPQIGQLSDLGLVEMTRHRQGQSLSEIFTRRCTTCNGTGHALEEFSWMQPGGDSDRNRSGRPNKLPMRQPNRQQPLPRPAVSLNRKDKPRIAGQLTEPTLAEAARNHVKNDAGKTAGTTVSSVSDPQKPPTQEALMEFYEDLMMKSLAVKLARGLKLGWLPIPVNNLISRINPKANDIVTLVRSIEAAGSFPTHNDEEDSDLESVDSDSDADSSGETDHGSLRESILDYFTTENNQPEPIFEAVHESEDEQEAGETLEETVVAIRPRRGKAIVLEPALESMPLEPTSQEVSEAIAIMDAEDNGPLNDYEDDPDDDQEDLHADHVHESDHDDEESPQPSSLATKPGVLTPAQGAALAKRRGGRPRNEASKKRPQSGKFGRYPSSVASRHLLQSRWRHRSHTDMDAKRPQGEKGKVAWVRTEKESGKLSFLPMRQVSWLTSL